MSNEDVSAFECATRCNFETAWTENYGLLISKARRLTANSHFDPEDLLSQATIRALRYVEGNKEIESFVGLMVISMQHAQIDSQKAMREKIFSQACALVEDFVSARALQTAMDAERELIAKDELAGLLEYIGTFPLTYRRVFALRFLDGVSCAEIASRMGLSEVNVRQKIRQMRQKLLLWQKNRNSDRNALGKSSSY